MKFEIGQRVRVKPFDDIPKYIECYREEDDRVLINTLSMKTDLYISELESRYDDGYTLSSKDGCIKAVYVTSDMIEPIEPEKEIDQPPDLDSFLSEIGG